MVEYNINFFGTVLLVLMVCVITGVWYSLLYTHGQITRKKKSDRKSPLQRHDHNPIISPHPYNDWEAAGTFNPATYVDDAGQIHLLYRAVGNDGISRIGYAVSENGIEFDRLPYAVFTMLCPRKHDLSDINKKYDPVMYPSGGSWGGCEDPRIVRIEGKLYVTFNTFDGWDFIRIGAISISEADFLNKRWKWSTPLLLSPPGEVHKNWVLFPEKMNGKFAILHSISPEVQIDYVDSLEQLAYGLKKIKSIHGQKKRVGWDNRVRGAGPPPIKTAYGWLVLYHAISDDEPDKYKLGALLLDLDNPTQVIARCDKPLLTPDHWYENEWKPGIVYATGAVVKDDILSVYYGGGDKHVCSAHTPLVNLFGWLQTQPNVQ